MLEDCVHFFEVRVCCELGDQSGEVRNDFGLLLLVLRKPLANHNCHVDHQ